MGHLAPPEEPTTFPPIAKALKNLAPVDPIAWRDCVTWVFQPLFRNIWKDRGQRAIWVIRVVSVPMIEVLDHFCLIERHAIRTRFGQEQARVIRHVEHRHESETPWILLGRTLANEY